MQIQTPTLRRSSSAILRSNAQEAVQSSNILSQSSTESFSSTHVVEQIEEDFTFSHSSYFQAKTEAIKTLKTIIETQFSSDVKFSFKISDNYTKDSFTISANPEKVLQICEFISSQPQLITYVQFNAATL